MKKTLSLVLVLLMVAGCAFAAPDYLNLDGELPIVKEGQTVSLTLTSLQADAYPSEPESIWLWEYMRQAMNLDLTVEHVLASAKGERLSLMMVSGDLPDILIGFGLNTTELVRYGQVEGQLLDIAPYINEELTPNMMKAFAMYPEAIPAMTAPDGGVYTVVAIVEDVDHGPRHFINTAWLAENGLEMPATLDDYTAMLRAYKEANADAVPLNGSVNGNDPRAFLLTAFGYVTTANNGMSAALKGGEVVIPAADATYEEFLKLMKDYYDEGLISQDFFTLEGTAVNAEMAEGKAIASSTGAPYLQLPEFDDYDKWDHITPLTSAFNDAPIYVKGSSVNVGGMVFSSATKYPEALVRIADFFFGNKGGIYKWGGPISGTDDCLGMVGGATFTDDGSGAYSFDDVTSGKYPSTYAAICSTIAPWGGSETFGYRKDIDSSDPTHGSIWVSQSLAGVTTVGKVYREDYGDDNWRLSREKYALPYLTGAFPYINYFTEDESVRMNELITLIRPHVETETAKFITGVRPLDQFDLYLDELKDLGVDELLAFYQAAYEAYQANMAK